MEKMENILMGILVVNTLTATAVALGMLIWSLQFVG